MRKDALVAELSAGKSTKLSDQALKDFLGKTVEIKLAREIHTASGPTSVLSNWTKFRTWVYRGQ